VGAVFALGMNQLFNTNVSFEDRVKAELHAVRKASGLLPK
jgi:hypothetical protein